MPVRELKRFIKAKNKSLRLEGLRVCANQSTAYQQHIVPVTTSLNLLQNEVLTHIEFDVANSSQKCDRQIQARVQTRLRANFKPVPIRWTNVQYTLPTAILFLLLTISLAINYHICVRVLAKSGPMRQGFELTNRN